MQRPQNTHKEATFLISFWKSKSQTHFIRCMEFRGILNKAVTRGKGKGKMRSERSENYCTFSDLYKAVKRYVDFFFLHCTAC